MTSLWSFWEFQDSGSVCQQLGQSLGEIFFPLLLQFKILSKRSICSPESKITRTSTSLSWEKFRLKAEPNRPNRLTGRRRHIRSISGLIFFYTNRSNYSALSSFSRLNICYPCFCLRVKNQRTKPLRYNHKVRPSGGTINKKSPVF